jgi:lambda repressor-like predicted transcriptional regulator
MTGRKSLDLPADKIIALHKQGLSIAAIATRFGVCSSTIRERLGYRRIKKQVPKKGNGNTT